MTGYGTGSAQKGAITVSVEIKTVNHRFLDLHIRLAREYLFLEGDIQQMVRGALDRGRVDVNTVIQNTNAAAFLMNTGLIRRYLEAAGKIKEEFHIQDSLDLKTLVNLPGVLQNEAAAPSEDAAILADLVRRSMQAALEGVEQMRKQEGEALKADMLQNLAVVEDNARRIRELSLNSASEYLEKLRERIARLLPQSGIDPQRLAQEAAFIADKSDISEEIARLESHIRQYRALADGKEKAGKKLDFMLQEMQRETNTILSKSGDLEISRLAIAIKTDIEKLREQVQNIE
jgi:uncharacterized protein (TIGR00255 family)